MATNAKPVYERILLRLNGEALRGSEDSDADASILDRMVQGIEGLIELNIQVDVVIGGGNLLCGVGLARAGMSRVVDNRMGMLAIVMNGLAVRDTLHRAHANACLMSAIPLNGVHDNHSWAEAISLLRNNRVVILSADTGSSSFTTDPVACLCDIEVEAGMVLKATEVDGMFTVNPTKDPSATVYDQLTYSEVLDKELRVMDLAAFTLIRNYKLPIRASNMNEPDALRHVIMDEKEGTLITE